MFTPTLVSASRAASGRYVREEFRAGFPLHDESGVHPLEANWCAAPGHHVSGTGDAVRFRSGWFSNGLEAMDDTFGLHVLAEPEKLSEVPRVQTPPEVTPTATETPPGLH